MSSSFLPRRAIVMGRRRSASTSAASQQNDSLELIAADLLSPSGGCPRCKLSQSRGNIVVGEGNPQAELVFVGESPGDQEGAQGQLLYRMIQAMGLQREQVYICNVVKCGPSENRNPGPDEIAACSPFLTRQLDVIRPKVVVALGKLAAQTLLQTEDPISKLRGNFHPYRNGAKLMPTFDTAHLLHNPESKREAWEDLQQVAAELGIKIPKRS